jgi:5'-nucleotidase
LSGINDWILYLDKLSALFLFPSAQTSIMKFLNVFLLLLLSLQFSCKTSRSSSSDDGRVQVVFVQVNDVYEIAPIEKGKFGGMARVATLKKRYLDSNRNTFLVVAGDFLSPSIYNSLVYEKKRVRGKQMVESMNAAGVDFAIFGNHEFDINEDELQSRIDESAFQWISSNTFHFVKDSARAFQKLTPAAYEEIPQYQILTVTDADGTAGRIGIIGLTLNSNKAAYVRYVDPFATAKTLYDQLKGSCDAVVAVTHQTIADDEKLAEAVPGLALIIGGHEHNMQFKKAGNIFITKAHSNARSAYILTMNIDKRKKTVSVEPRLQMITDSIAADPQTDAIVKKWMNIADSNYSSLGFDPHKVILQSGEPLDGRETEIRNKETNLTNMVVRSMKAACPDADLVCFNAGSIRLDDILEMPVTQYDMLRTLPFGGGIPEIEVKGDLLQKILDAGRRNKNGGGFLHCYPVTYDSTLQSWQVAGAAIDREKIYRVAITDYMLTGMETNFGFLNRDNPEIVRIFEAEKNPSDSRSDIRLAIVRYLQSRNQ